MPSRNSDLKESELANLLAKETAESSSKLNNWAMMCLHPNTKTESNICRRHGSNSKAIRKTALRNLSLTLTAITQHSRRSGWELSKLDARA
jgi:predicted GTPase